MSRAARFESRGRRERVASQLLGMDVRHVPKSTLAVVAVYLALALDESRGFDGARERLWQEWELLYQQGIIEAPKPRRAQWKAKQSS
jgi:hypothetical protein